uniref:alpha-1,2-Mannosidase n=1 Tax=Rodentolepis nana TaxID=102285 RepID=A0A0R3T3R7_RODNA
LPMPPFQTETGSRLLYCLGNICNHFMTIPFLENVCDRKREAELPYHAAHKKVAHLDLDNGELIKPTQPNALKLEKFIFDVFKFSQIEFDTSIPIGNGLVIAHVLSIFSSRSRRFYIWEVDRATEFSPLKNGPGAQKDCPETCRKAILELHTKWAKAAGAVFENEEKDILEISPLVSVRGENLECLKGVKIEGVNVLEMCKNESGEYYIMRLILIILISIYLFTYSSYCNENLDLESLKQRVRDLFYHGYDNYMKHAYPYDELRPISCDGHDTWGGFSLSLIDALDTLVVLGNHTEFQRAVNLILENVDTNQNVNISVFETNIRVVGGLISAHLLAKRAGLAVEPGWPCHGKLLDLAERFASKLLHAFETPTGMPYGTVNLGKGRVPRDETPISCVATVGTLILEFGTLSRLTGDPRYEEAAMKALRALWSHRSTIGLVGNHINVLTGAWVGREATIGTGADSYFEYLLKGSILFRLPELDAMFREYRESISKYLRFGQWHVMASMDTGMVTSAVYQSLESFWPGVLSMAGGIQEAKELLLSYHSVWKKFGFLPEMFDFVSGTPLRSRNIYPLRPEFIESIMHVYRATKDPYLLEMGVNILTSIEKDAKTSCGFATIHNVQTHTKENRMESFFLSETVKYLYLLFDEDNFLHRNPLSVSDAPPPGNGDNLCSQGTGYIFNSEAHPLDAGLIHCCSVQHLRESEVINSAESLPHNLGLTTDLGSLVNGSAVTSSFHQAVLAEVDSTFKELLSPSVTWTDENSGESTNTDSIDDFLEQLWRSMSADVLLSSSSRENPSVPPDYVPPSMHRNSGFPLMTCPTMSFHARLNSMRDMDYRNLK